MTHFDSQLEAIIRISESLAKMSLSPVASEQHVDEAIRLFRISTLVATQSGYGKRDLAGGGMMEISWTTQAPAVWTERPARTS